MNYLWALMIIALSMSSTLKSWAVLTLELCVGSDLLVGTILVMVIVTSTIQWLYTDKSHNNHPSYPDRGYVVVRSWAIVYPYYHPVDFTHGSVLANDLTVKAGGWADPVNFASINFGERVSYEGPIQLNADGSPQSPWGRTGMSGRGLLGKWGPNHAADPIVTRYDPATGSLQVVLITRGDTGELAIPGGMVDAGEKVSQTLAREFNEEATSGCNPAVIKSLFNQHKIVYRGIVDDPRNTDNAWMETTACHFHCDTEMGALLPLTAGDDAVHVQWQAISAIESGQVRCYANHTTFILMAVKGMPRIQQ